MNIDERIASLFKLGLSQKEIGIELKMSQQAISKRLKNMGLKPDPSYFPGVDLTVLYERYIGRTFNGWEIMEVCPRIHTDDEIRFDVENKEAGVRAIMKLDTILRLPY